MMQTRRTLRIYWAAVTLCTVLLAWWVFFFARQGHILVRRIAASGEHLSAAEETAVRDAADHTLRMFVFEGGFLGLLLIASVALVVRSLRREIEVNRQQRNFLSAVTHELRSPLASARLYLESIALGRAEGEKQARYLQHAQEDLERLRRLVEEMLASAKLKDGRAVLEREDLALASFVKARASKLFSHDPALGAAQLGAAQLNFVIASDPVVSADREALGKIVDNLVSNAIKYGGDAPEVQVHVSHNGEFGRFEVLDSGPGLCGADPKLIFEPFVRGGDEDVRQNPGVGLGLFLVGQLAQAHGGRVGASDRAPERTGSGADASSGKASGALFWVELPLAPTDSAA